MLAWQKASKFSSISSRFKLKSLGLDLCSEYNPCFLKEQQRNFENRRELKYQNSVEGFQLGLIAEITWIAGKSEKISGLIGLSRFIPKPN